MLGSVVDTIIARSADVATPMLSPTRTARSSTWKVIGPEPGRARRWYWSFSYTFCTSHDRRGEPSTLAVAKSHDSGASRPRCGAWPSGSTSPRSSSATKWPAGGW
jgi:hypothetical protein